MAALPGVLAGIQLAGLLFFLNPHLRFNEGRLLRGSMPYALVLGSISLGLILPWTWSDFRRAKRWLPWGLTAALALAAVLDWTHAARFADFLPPGIKARLIKVAVFLSAGALIAFQTSLLHRLHRRPFGLKSRWAMVLITVLSIYVVIERRDAYRPEAPQLRESALPATAARPRLVVVAVEGATMDAVLPLAEQGRLPFLASALRQGACGRLRTIKPFRRSSAWESLATGKLPFRHGVVSDRFFRLPLFGERPILRIIPEGIFFRHWGVFGAPPEPFRRTDSSALHAWQILSRLGVPSGQVAWPLTEPPAPELAFTVTESFFQHRSADLAAPPEIAARAELFQVRSGEVDPLLLSRFGEPLPPWLLAPLARDSWIESLSLFLLEEPPAAGAAFLALPGLAEISQHTFGGYAAVEFDGAQGGREREAAQRLAAYYTEVDAFLQRIWERAQEPTVLAVVSPAGTGEHRGASWAWETLTGRDSLRGSSTGAPDGVLLLLGPGISEGTRLVDAEVVDVVPTLLYGLGFPIARDMDGKVLTAAYSPERLRRLPLTFVPSYEALPAAP